MPTPPGPAPGASALDRRGEAHLWLLLEEALRSVRTEDVEPWEAWRNFRAVAEALVSTSALDSSVADALTGELDDALAVRGVVPRAAFRAATWPGLDVLLRPRPPTPPGAATVWLEAEIERHLDLFVSFGPGARAWAAADLLRIVGGPAQAFVAVGLLPRDGGRLLHELRASLAAAGVELPPSREPDVPPREAWAGFLRRRPGPLPNPLAPTEARQPFAPLGELGGAEIRVDRLAWSPEALELELAVRRAASVDPHQSAIPWHVRVEDDRGRLHLGQPMPLRRGAAAFTVALRPGLEPDVAHLDVRVSRGGERAEARIDL